MNAFHRDVKKHISHTRSLKRFLIYCRLSYKTAENVFSFIFYEFEFFSTKLKYVYAFGLTVSLSVHPFVHALTLVNILQMS